MKYGQAITFITSRCEFDFSLIDGGISNGFQSANNAIASDLTVDQRGYTTRVDRAIDLWKTTAVATDPTFWHTPDRQWLAWNGRADEVAQGRRLRQDRDRRQSDCGGEESRGEELSSHR